MKIELLFVDEGKLTLDGFDILKEDSDWIYFINKDNGSEYQFAKTVLMGVLKTK